MNHKHIIDIKEIYCYPQFRLTKRDDEMVGDVGLGDPLPENEDEEEEEDEDEDDEEDTWSDYASWGLDKRGLGSVV